MEWLKRWFFEIFSGLLSLFLITLLAWVLWVGKDQMKHLERADTMLGIVAGLSVGAILLSFYRRILITEQSKERLKTQVAEQRVQNLMNRRLKEATELMESTNPSSEIGGLHILSSLFSESVKEGDKQCAEQAYQTLWNYLMKRGEEELKNLSEIPQIGPVTKEHPGLQTAFQVFFGKYDEQEGLRSSAFYEYGNQKLNLSKKCFVRVDLRAAQLEGVDLEETILDNSTLFRTHFVNANLQGARWVRAYASGAKFMGAQLLHATASEANLYGADFRRACLGTTKENAFIVEDADISGIVLLGKKEEEDAKGIEFVNWTQAKHLEQIERNEAKRKLLKERYPQVFENVLL
ncbi:MAG: pentapeptide repeat-containing protein [Cytophagales bacterium]|nr:pentapeptide repeat-containing protein [Cytophagales bacterium]